MTQEEKNIVVKRLNEMLCKYNKALNIHKNNSECHNNTNEINKQRKKQIEDLISKLLNDKV